MQNYHNDDELLILAGKYLSGNATPHEIAFLEQYYNLFEKEPDALSQLTEEDRQALTTQMSLAIKEKIARQEAGKVIDISTPNRRKWLIPAAVALLLISLSVIYLRKPRTIENDMTKNEKPAGIYKNDVAPGGNNAILTLANGKTIALDSVKNGRLADQGTTTILKVAEGQLAYNTENNGKGKEAIYNTITTPRGGQYLLILADGSKVFLNAASSIRFPVAFSGNERKVEITGEAYFDVVHNDATPFIVSVGGVEIKDLGTSFNINAYPDEPGIATTVITGLVSLKHADKQTQLTPGKKAVVIATENNITLTDADIVQTLAWKDGSFDFRGQDIAAIMRQVGRWYDVEISYEKPIPRDTYSGRISRNRNLSKILKALEGGGLHFTINGKKVIVTP